MKVLTGSVFQRKDGRWVAQYWLEGKRKLAYGKNEDDAIQKRQKVLENLKLSVLPELCNRIEHELTCANNCLTTIDNNLNSVFNETNTNEYITKTNGNEKMEHGLSCMTLGEWLVEWLRSYVRPSKNISTYKGYELYINKHIIPAIGDVKLQALSKEVFQNFFNKKALNGRLDGKAGGMSPKSMENMRFMLNAAIRQAFDNELVSENYIINININKTPKKEVISLRLEEEERLITACEQCENISTFGIIVALRIGLQLGELLALKWDDIDIPNKQIYVNRALSRCFNDTDACSKSALRFSISKAVRIIYEYDMPKGLFSEICAHRAKQIAKLGSVPDAVIASSTGGHIDPGNYNKLFKRMLAESGIPNVNFDILRNTFALRYLERSFDPEGLSLVLGCSNTSKSIKKYTQIYHQQKQNN